MLLSGGFKHGCNSIGPATLIPTATPPTLVDTASWSVSTADPLQESVIVGLLMHPGLEDGAVYVTDDPVEAERLPPPEVINHPKMHPAPPSAVRVWVPLTDICWVVKPITGGVSPKEVGGKKKEWRRVEAITSERIDWNKHLVGFFIEGSPFLSGVKKILSNLDLLSIFFNCLYFLY